MSLDQETKETEKDDTETAVEKDDTETVVEEETTDAGETKAEADVSDDAPADPRPILDGGRSWSRCGSRWPWQRR